MSETFDYKTLFNQSTNRRTPNLGDQYTNVQNAQALYGPQGAVQPTAPRQPFRPFENFSLFPTVNASTETPPTETSTPTPDPNAPIANLQKTPGEVFTEAQARYLAMATENRQLQSEGIQRAGGDQYAQARMAMEQQMALSDTRGLTAGAKEGAQQTLSATQQVALNQIESNTQSQLLELKAQGVQDEFLAQEFAHMKYQELSITNPLFRDVDTHTRAYEHYKSMGDTVNADRSFQLLQATEKQIYNQVLTEQEKEILNNPDASPIELTARADKVITRILDDPNGWDIAMGLGLIVLGTVTIAAATYGTVATGGFAAPFTTPAKGWGAVAVVAGIAAIAGGFGWSMTEGQKTGDIESKTNRVNNILKQQRALFISKGFTNEEIDIAFRARMAKEAPIYRDLLGK